MIKVLYVDALILITCRWDLKFHVHTNASNLAVGTILAHNINIKCD
jgi:hypothetical protein